jgi:hypothetical protein
MHCAEIDHHAWIPGMMTLRKPVEFFQSMVYTLLFRKQ